MAAKTLLAFLMEVWFTQLTSALTDQVVLRPTSPYCTDHRPSSLVCDFSLTTQPVYLVTSPRPKRAASLDAYESIEIRNAAVFYLSESGCLAEINIRDTKEVIVDDLHQKKRRAEECERYQLSVVNSSITNIPAKVTGLNVVRSNVERLVLPPGIKRASVSQSRVEFFSTTHPLNGSVVFEVSFTNVSFVGKLNVKDNATFQLLSSRLTLKNMSEIAFEDNADILISRSHLLSPNTVQFLVERGVSLTLEDNTGNSSALPPTVSPKKHEGKQCPKCERPTASLESLSESVLIGCLATSLVVVFGSLSYVVYLKRHFGKKPERQLGGKQATSFDDLSGDSIRTLTQQLPPTRALPPTPLQPSLRPPKTAHIKSRRQSPMYQDVLKYENSFQSHLVAQEMNDDDGYLPAIEPQMQTFAQSHCGGEPDRQGGDENERADMGSEESLYEPMP